MSKVIQLPNLGKKDRERYRKIQGELVNHGIFSHPDQIPSGLVHWLVQHWQRVYNAGVRDTLENSA